MQGENQIQPKQRKNEITSYGGSRNWREMVLKEGNNVQMEGANFKFPVIRAFIMDINPNVDGWVYDIGTLEIEKSKPYFRTEDLDLEISSYSLVRPICLAAENYNFDTQKIHGVGWGFIYEERPTEKDVKKVREPFASSCMTNEVSSKEWKFLMCNMKDIKANDWSCEKNNFPNGITKSVREQCKKYFSIAEKAAKKNNLDSIKIYRDQCHQIEKLP